MKRKNLSEVHMREVIENKIKIIEDNELNAYITLKHVVKTSQKCTSYINGRKTTILDDGYSILEYSPKGEYYNVRIFIDKEGNILRYYFDVIYTSKFTENDIIYDDLYLDVVYDTKFANKCANYIFLEDQGELKDALTEGKINVEQFDIAYNVAHKLMDELLNGTNKFVNQDNKDYFRMMEII